CIRRCFCIHQRYLLPEEVVADTSIGYGLLPLSHDRNSGKQLARILWMDGVRTHLLLPLRILEEQDPHFLTVRLTAEGYCAVTLYITPLSARYLRIYSIHASLSPTNSGGAIPTRLNLPSITRLTVAVH